MDPQSLLTDPEKLKFLRDFCAAPIVLGGAAVAAEVAGIAGVQAVIAFATRKALMASIRSLDLKKEVVESIDRWSLVGGVWVTGVTTIVMAQAAWTGGGTAVAGMLSSCGSFGLLGGTAALVTGSSIVLVVLPAVGVVVGGYFGLKFVDFIQRIFKPNTAPKVARIESENH